MNNCQTRATGRSGQGECARKNGTNARIEANTAAMGAGTQELAAERRALVFAYLMARAKLAYLETGGELVGWDSDREKIECELLRSIAIDAALQTAGTLRYPALAENVTEFDNLAR